jgi:hypothetical protein
LKLLLKAFRCGFLLSRRYLVLELQLAFGILSSWAGYGLVACNGKGSDH